MKLNRIGYAKYLGLLLLAVMACIGCDDTTGTLGVGMLPESDGLSTHTAIFNVKTRSFIADSVFAKTMLLPLHHTQQ